MGRALSKACGSERSEHDTRACRVITAAWRCPADIRRAFDRWGPEAVVVMRPSGGEWYGAVFGRRGDAWQVLGFDGGDIP